MHDALKTYIGRRYDTLEPVKVLVENRCVIKVESTSDSTDVELPWIAPGLFDIQVNGAVGVEFSSSKLTVEGVFRALDKVRKDGVFRCCPTLTTNAPDVMVNAARTIALALQQRPEYKDLVWGIHLEGPFISTAEGSVGAHPKKYCRPYSYELFQEIQNACGGLVKLLTLSPEYDGVGEFVKRLTAQGCVVAIGHTNANAAQINEAVLAGATLSTHLSNATRHLLPKWENYFFTQLADDRLCASIIVDGFHISPQLVRTIVRAKGKERLILISDQSPLAGYPPGRYSMELCDFQIQPNGKVTLAGDPNLLACASFPVTNCVANVAAIADLSLYDAFELAVTHPAQLLNAPRFSNGANDFLEVGALADFILFRLQKPQMGPLGVLDGASFVTGKFIFHHIVWHGEQITED